jgi:hypothetical protein
MGPAKGIVDRPRPIALLFFACIAQLAGLAAMADDVPEWVSDGKTRFIDNGYLVYIGAGEDRQLELARFKAQSMAIRSLINELLSPSLI